MLKFKDRKFRIMQVSDPQDLQFVRPTMVKMLNAAYDKYKPDLIVLTGDNILGNHLRDARIGTHEAIKDLDGEREAMRIAIDKVMAPIEERKIPVAMIFGNHDDKNSFTKKEQADMYRKYSSNIGLDCVAESGDEATYNIPIYSEDGSKVLFNVWMLDSAWLDREENKGYELIKPEAIEWYKKTSQRLKEENGGQVVPSLMFQHIPMIETLELIEECDKKDPLAVKGPEGKFFKLKKGVEGVLGEYPCPVEKKTGQMEAIKECGDVKAIVYGHDHTNCFEGVVDGLRMIQTACASFRCYGTRYRGVRLFDINEDGSFDTKFYDYREICGKSLINELRFIWDADGFIAHKIALIAGCVGLAAAIGIILSRII